MVFKDAARKTGGYMAVSALLGVAIVTFATEDLSPAGRVVSSPTDAVSGSGWLIFALGLFIGALMVGTYVYLAHIEKKRES